MSPKMPHFSVTEAKIASICPRQFILNKKYNKRIFRGRSYGIGSAIHKIIEDFAKSALKSNKFIKSLDKADVKSVYNIFSKGIHVIFMDLSNTGKFSRWPISELELVGDSLEIVSKELSDRFIRLNKLSTTNEALKRLFIAIEWSFNHRFEIHDQKREHEIEIGGRIDWLSMDSDDETITIWDFKTSPVDNIERDLIQIATYSIVLEEKFKVPISAALYYITGNEIATRKISSETLKQFKPRVLKNLVHMANWLNNEDGIPFTGYKDVCQDCIVTKDCIKRFGTNPHLQELNITEKTKIDSPKEPITIIEDMDDFSIQPDEQLIKKAQQEEIKRITSEEPSGNLVLGKDLKSDKSIEIHPLIFIRHGVILGASGSGKTVLGKVIIEELLQLNHSAILIDPQGDLCSLALAADEKGKKIVSNVPITIFTPNSEKGRKLTINLLAPPAPEILKDYESLKIVLDTTATQILDILGYSLKKIPSEKALLEAILKEDWLEGKKFDIRAFAERIHNTGRIKSVLDDSEIDIELLLSPKKVKDLSKNLMKLAIGTEGSFFAGGHSLDLTKLSNRAPQLYIINLASVGTDQTKRQMVVSWILREIYDWLLRNPQKEQDRIRFTLYIDEVADFLPPHPHNPPSKKMLMLLIRQARKYGCACILATQSPATIDYKAIDNVNTLFIGRIPSEQSIKKIDTFLEPYGREIQKILRKVQTVKPGQFLLIGGGLTEPSLFQTRWLHTKHETLSLDDVEILMKKQQ